MTKIQVVAGAQFGSEAKGHVTHRLVMEEVLAGHDVVNVRVGGPNAGHTVYAEDGSKFAFRQLPVGAVVQGVTPVISAGSEIDLPVLIDEIGQRRDWFQKMQRTPPPLLIDLETTMIEDRHKQTEGDRDLVRSIGSTGKGIGAARADRLMRSAARLKDDLEARHFLDAQPDVLLGNTAPLLNENDPLRTVVIEGTQGYGLGLHAGFYPQCTAGDCTAVDFLAQARISPFAHRVEPWIVARMFPIRVAGNSGPLEGETSWAALGLPPEYTTVTKKERRVGLWDQDLFVRALEANGGASVVRVALTMLDQKFPKAEGAEVAVDLGVAALDWISRLSQDTGADVRMVTTSARTAAWI